MYAEKKMTPRGFEDSGERRKTCTPAHWGTIINYAGGKIYQLTNWHSKHKGYWGLWGYWKKPQTPGAGPERGIDMGNNNVEAQGGNHNGMGCCQLPRGKVEEPTNTINYGKMQETCFSKARKGKTLKRAPPHRSRCCTNKDLSYRVP